MDVKTGMLFFQAFVATGMMVTIIFSALAVRNLVTVQRSLMARIEELERRS